MHHEFALIATLAWGLGLALVLGFAATKVKLPALVGYLLAGVCIAPTTPGFVGDMDLAAELSEVGVMLLMFGVGLHFSLTDLLRVKTVALPGAIIQMAIATAIGMGMAHWWGWSWGEAFILGLSLSCASTVVLMKGLEAKGWLQRSRGQLAVGWLVVEDLVTVLLLVLLPSIATFFKGEAPGDGSLTVAILETTVLIIGFIASMLVIGRRVLPWVLFQAVKTGSQEVFTLCVIAIAIGVAYASAQIFNVSFALGAFFAGMMMRESEYSHRAALQTLPLQDAFSVIFFLGVGMLFNPMIIIENPLHVLGIVLVIIVCKSITAAVWVKVMGRSYKDALTVGAALAQVGEFSFILAGLGLNLGLLPEEGMSLILAGGIISIALNPLFESEEGILRGRDVVDLYPDGQRIDLLDFIRRLESRIEADRQLLSQEDRRLFETILNQTVTTKLSHRINNSQDWTRRMSAIMERLNTSMGLRFSLTWKGKPADQQEELGTSELIELLRKDPAVMGDADRNSIIQHFLCFF